MRLVYAYIRPSIPSFVNSFGIFGGGFWKINHEKKSYYQLYNEKLKTCDVIFFILRKPWRVSQIAVAGDPNAKFRKNFKLPLLSTVSEKPLKQSLSNDYKKKTVSNAFLLQCLGKYNLLLAG